MFGVSALRTEVGLLRTQVAGLRHELEVHQNRGRTEAELIAMNEVLVLRKLVKDLLGGKPEIDKFLDVLGDHAILFQAGPLQGDIETLHREAGRPLPGDLGDEDASLNPGGSE